MPGCCRRGGEHPLIQSTRHMAGSDTQMYRCALYISEVFKSGRYILGSSPCLPETIFRSLASHPAPPAIPPRHHHHLSAAQGNSITPWTPRVFIVSSFATPTSHHRPSDFEHVWAFSLHSRPTSRPVTLFLLPGLCLLLMRITVIVLSPHR